VRERLQQLAAEQLVRRFTLAQSGGGAMNYYKLTAAGFASLHGPEPALPPRAYFAEIPLSRLQHTLAFHQCANYVTHFCLRVETRCQGHDEAIDGLRFGACEENSLLVIKLLDNGLRSREPATSSLGM